MVNIKNILIVAGEASGDLHGANLIREIKKLDPSVKFFGIGGDMMKAAGVDTSYHVREMAVVGILEVAGKFRLIKKAMKDMETLLDAIRPKAVILIDYPGFNLRLAGRAKQRGIKVIYYISPQVWAWHKSRVKTIAKVVDKMLVAFPFEVPIYREAGVDVEFVGHPLMDVVPGIGKDEARRKLGIESGVPVIGILPGSRKKEVEFLLPEMLRAADLIAKKVDGAQFVIPVANTLDTDFVKGFTSDHNIDLQMFDGKAYDVMAASDVLLITSGTATLEAAIIGTPMVITYRASLATYLISKLLVDIEYFGLPNIVAGKGIVPELLQGEATADRMGEEALRMLNDAGYVEGLKTEFKRVRDALGGPGASRRAAEVVYRAV